MRIGIVLFDQVDLLDVGGPYEVFLTANRLQLRRGEPEPFEVSTIGVGGTVVESYGGLGLRASHDLDTVGSLHAVVVPGTIDIDAASDHPELTSAILALAARSTVVTSVCTGAVLLARAGLLDDVSAATTHHEDVDVLAQRIGERAITARWVDAGSVVTSGGLSSGVAMALHLVERWVTRDLAVATAAQLAYDWDPDDGVHAGRQ